MTAPILHRLKSGLISLEANRRLDLSGAPFTFHLVRYDRHKLVEQIIFVEDSPDLADRLQKALMNLNKVSRRKGKPKC